MLERATNNFDFLRVVGAICILFTHSFDLLKKIYDEPLVMVSKNTVSIGLLALGLFFSISGYLIIKSVFNSESVLNYFWKRFLRLMPLLIFVCLVTVFILGPWITNLSLKSYFRTSDTWSYFRNLFPAAGLQFTLPGVFQNNPAQYEVNGSLWTLIIEERLYLLSGIFLFIKKKKLFFILILIIFNLFYFINYISKSQIFWGFYENIAVYWGLIFLNSGGLYILNIKFNRSFNGKKLLFVFFLLTVSYLYRPLQFLQIYTIPYFTIMIANYKCKLNHAGRWGDFSYGIYIFSFPVQQLFIHFKMTNQPYLLFIYSLLIVVPLSILSWNLLEKKMIQFKGKLK